MDFANLKLVNEIEEGLKKGGMGYGTIKKMLAEAIAAELAPIHEKYVDYMTHYDKVEEMLQEGAQKARALARPVLDRFKATVLNNKQKEEK